MAGQYVEDKVPGTRMIYLESLNVADRPETTLEQVVSDMVDQGATLIFTTSDAFEDDTTLVAAKFPDIIFVNISGDDALTGEAPENLGNVMGQIEPMKAVAGAAAALKTTTGSVATWAPSSTTRPCAWRLRPIWAPAMRTSIIAAWIRMTWSLPSTGSAIGSTCLASRWTQPR